ncbi:MAG: 3-phosphoshikimate 1-carboxyvinyltransferase, partial [Clostridia bacterium]|nr:3-phosphoshikimate 1-carboxyvinyltransferase [Clostridia bacterium]
MQVTLRTPAPRGSLCAPPSKSEAHRALICAALADAPTQIVCNATNDDIDATIDCLRALGARIERTEGSFLVTPIAHAPTFAELDARESGSTLRFLLPVIAALGTTARIQRRGRLPRRPLSPLRELLAQNGARLIDHADGSLEISGQLKGNDFAIAADVSSQFVSGLLFALPLLQAPTDCHIRLLGQVESRP